MHTFIFLNLNKKLIYCKYLPLAPLETPKTDQTTTAETTAKTELILQGKQLSNENRG